MSVTNDKAIVAGKATEPIVAQSTLPTETKVISPSNCMIVNLPLDNGPRRTPASGSVEATGSAEATGPAGATGSTVLPKSGSGATLPDMGHLIFVRHGQSVVNALNKDRPGNRIFCGQLDTPLTSRGRAEAVAAGRQLARFPGIRVTTAVSSPLARTRETLALILDQLPGPVEWLAPRSELAERSLGAFEGREEEAVYREYPRFRDEPAYRQFDNHFQQRAPGGENLNDVIARAWPAVQRLESETSGDLLVVSHYSTIRSVLHVALGLDPDETLTMRVPNAVPIIVTRGPEYRRIAIV